MTILHQETKRPTGRRPRQAPSGGRKRQVHGKKKGSSRGLDFLRFLSGCPGWLVWLGGLLVAALYACFFYYVFVGPFSFRWRAIYGNPPQPEGYDICGIDISHYQGSINWERLRNASIGTSPIRFIFIKATEGERLMDDNFNENFYQSRQNDFIRGAYHFFIPGTDPRRQAQFFLHQVHLEPGDLPPVLDVEKSGRLTPEQLRRDVKTWLDIVEERYGTKPILYTGYKFKLRYLDTPEFDTYPYWIAHYYVDELEYQGRWDFWQQTDCGRVDGIRGFVDVNIFNGNLRDLQDMTLGEESPEEVPE